MLKTFSSSLLGLILLTSLLGFSYATTNPQPLQNNSNNNDLPCQDYNPTLPHYNSTCRDPGAKSIGPGDNPHPSHSHPSCNADGANPKSPDLECCIIDGHGAEGFCCLSSTSPHVTEASDVQPDTNTCIIG